MTSDPTVPPDPAGSTGSDGLERRKLRDALLAETDPDIWTEVPEPSGPGEGGAGGEQAGDETAAGGEEPAGAPGDRPRRKASPPKSSTRNALEWAGVILGAVLIAVVVRTFIFQTFWIPSESMHPTLVEGDRVIVNKLSYRFHDVNRGDVVVFERPPNEPAQDVKDLIKRVVALSGETISISDGGVFIDGKALDEPYVHGLETTYGGPCGSGDVTGINTDEGFTVPDGHVFVMGDNRVSSADSRCFGPIDTDLIVGRAFFIIWPPSKMGGL